ncbi:hypothetical protein OIO90_005391 [Microbotryomycetes sp. JL221]|nr:hypothetical protein OIO90_005391 [Microbotryomycetes sp. JL221]
MRVRKVLVDAFGTLFSPRQPVHVQYAQVAEQFGINVEPDKVKQSFKQAFKHWNSNYPLYGKLSRPSMTAFDWWSHVIRDTLTHAGAPKQCMDQVQHELLPALVQRFWCKEGYALHDDVASFLSHLQSLSSTTQGFVSAHPTVVSGSDQGVIKVLQDIGVLSDQAILEREVLTTWQIEHVKRDKLFWQMVLQRLNADRQAQGEDVLELDQVLVVGDELVADCLTPMSCGMQALLLKRPTATEHARSDYADEARSHQVTTVASLTEVVEVIERSYMSQR